MPGMTNLHRFQTALREANTPAFLVSDLANVFWLTGFTGSYGLAVVTPEEGVLITDSRYTLQAREQCRDLEVRSFGSPTDAADFLKQQLDSLGITQTGFDENVVTIALHRKWTERLKGIELQAATDPIGTLRMIKTPDEVRRIRAACRLADACLEHLLTCIRPGVTENELLLEIELFFRRNGSIVAFAPTVASGERSARPHGGASDKPLEVGDFLTFDLGAKVEGYCSDITRTFVIGEASERHKEVYEQVLKAEVAGINALKPGANGREIDGLARQILDEKGLAQYFRHGLGHGLGALVHDTGRLSASTDQKIEVGQVWTVEPGVYIEGFGGVRIEDDVLVTEEGVEILTSFPKALMVL